MQQLPPFPDIRRTGTDRTAVARNQRLRRPKRPDARAAPPETPPRGPDIDVPSPATPGTEPPTTPISPVG